MNETDEALVRRARKGDPAAFEALVRRHLAAAYAVALARLREPADAEDAIQDAFVTALQKLDQCRQPEQFRAWLLQIVRRRAHNVDRYLRRRDALPLERADRIGSGEDPLRAAERGQREALLLEALDVLTPSEREVVLLFDFEGLRHREIADQLDISEGSARVHLSNARRKLRERLGPAFLEET